VGWHAVGAPMRQRYARMVELGNKGSRELGFADAGALWRRITTCRRISLRKEEDRLWEQLRPLYESLHAYVRGQLRKKYGGELVPAHGPIPAHLLGNLWSQEWNNVYELMDSPKPPQSYNLTKILQERKTDARGMARYGEAFFTSLGFAPLPKSFWEAGPCSRKPADRDVICHASAWDVDSKEDLRIKMCIQVTEEDFRVIHTSWVITFINGRTTRSRRCSKQRERRISRGGGRHDCAFRDAGLLKKIGLIDAVPPASGTLITCCSRRWRRSRFCRSDCWWTSGAGKCSTGSETGELQQSVVELRKKYQGIAPAGGANGGGFLIQERSITYRGTCRTRDTFWRGFLPISVSKRALP